MKNKRIAYWGTTGLVAAFMVMSGVMDLLLPPEVVEAARHLGYPDYFMRMLGVAKLLGAVALVAPGLRTAKEWAYAGFAFDFIAAFVSHAALGDPVGNLAPPIVALAMLMGSYTLWRGIRDAAPAAGTEAPARA